MGNCVACMVKIHNKTDVYLLKPYKNKFEWGRLKYETEGNDVIYPNQTSIKAVQGRTGSPSGVKDSFTFEVVHQDNNIKIGQIELIFDVPYDTNIHTRSVNFKITNYSNVIIKIDTAEKWGGHGNGESLYKFFITYENPTVSIESRLRSKKGDQYYQR
ncbi:795_t:CDS:1 [Scutellospora calospora]|uniref:795_t:CDS:1 n=1 Tax=Scutellospora calospora TaxID=85575 RepID=A0ACA9JX13_9GLOM|nr:795_t:CDS:1 [Scutellospora calospora]